MKTTLRWLIDFVIGLMSAALFLGFFFEDEHRLFEGRAVTAGITAVMILFSLLFVGILKLASIERGGVYGMAHRSVEWLYPTPWSPVFRIFSPPLALGLGSTLGGFFRGGQFSTFGFAVVMGALSGLLLTRWFRNRFLKRERSPLR